MTGIEQAKRAYVRVRTQEVLAIVSCDDLHISETQGFGGDAIRLVTLAVARRFPFGFAQGRRSTSKGVTEK
jgi:hypothetical protein